MKKFKGVEVIKRDLFQFGYNENEIEQIADCVAQHKGKPIQPNSIESKILFDADRLEKSGIGGTYASYRAQIESELPVIEWAKKIAERGYKNEDFFSEKAKEISDNGLKEKENHFQEVIKSLEKRRDWSIEEKDLWE